MHYLKTTLFCTLLSLNIFAQPPTISAVSPAAGTIGTAVTIRGNYFSSTPTANTVYFGSVAGNVIAASDTELIATVPPGANAAQLSVTANGLLAFSPAVFYVTYDTDSTAFDVTSFGMPNNYQGMYPVAPAVQDFDLDGKPDLIYGEWMGGYSSKILKNNSTNGSFVFDSIRANIPVQSYSGGTNVIADFNGDGKADHLAMQDNFSDTLTRIAYRKNTSTAGSISFGNAQVLPARLYASSPLSFDADKDGRMDIAILNYSATTGPKYIALYRNTSTADNISFAPAVEFEVNINIIFFTSGDLNGDGLDDIVIGTSDSSVIVYKNTGSTGNISFVQDITLLTTSTRTQPQVADIDNDGKPDICGLGSNGRISFLRNTGSNGSLSFAAKQEFVLPTTYRGLKIANLNGDTLPDFIVYNSSSSAKTLTVLKNSSTAGTISFTPGINYKTNLDIQYVAVGDMDLDSKPDIILATIDNGYNYGQLSLLRNKIGEQSTVELCPPAASTAFKAIAGSTYQWQLNTDTAFVNLADNANYTGTNLQTLQLTSLPSAFNNYQYRCLTDGNPGKVFRLKFTNNWAGGGYNVNLGGIYSLWGNAANWTCGVVPDANTDVVINYGPVYVNANAICRTLVIKPGVQVSVAPGITLTVTH